MDEIKIVDLFCGVGGLTYGLRQAGLDVVEGVDVDRSCRWAYEENNPNARFVAIDASRYDELRLRRAFGHARRRVLVGCAPCQPFTTYAQGPRAADRDEWALLTHFADLALAVKPDVVSMENVPGLAKREVFERFVERLETIYEVSSEVVDCRLYGAPQRRKRLVVMASLRGAGKIGLPRPTHADSSDWRTVEESLGRLPELAAGESDADDPLHRAAALTELNLRRIRASKPGGTWRDWPVELRAPCHRRDSGSTYPSVYGRMRADEPSPTITGQAYGFGNGRFGHPEQDRAITLREAALLQTFPRDYRFVEPGADFGMKNVGRQIGNAVPPVLGEAIGRRIAEHLRPQTVS